MYKIEITKPAEKDILDAAIYIMDQLQNPTAANRLLDEVENKKTCPPSSYKTKHLRVLFCDCSDIG